MSDLLTTAKKVVDTRYSHAGWNDLNEAIGELHDCVKSATPSQPANTQAEMLVLAKNWMSATYAEQKQDDEDWYSARLGLLAEFIIDTFPTN